MPSSSINHRIRARSSIKSPCYGYGCGLKDAKACCTLLSPFQLQQFDFSPHAYRTAKRVLKEGESNKSRIEDAIQRLRARRNQIRGVMKQNRALLAPIHRLPDEVLILIFEEASWKFCADIAFSPSFQRMAAPWVISRVCRRWRRVTLSGTCSHFWVNIDVQLYKANHHIPLDWYMWFVELQSARAGSMPLHISVDFRIKPQPHKPDVRRMVLSFISKNSLRCYSMRINQPPTRFLTTLLSWTRSRSSTSGTLDRSPTKSGYLGLRPHRSYTPLRWCSRILPLFQSTGGRTLLTSI